MARGQQGSSQDPRRSAIGASITELHPTDKPARGVHADSRLPRQSGSRVRVSPTRDEGPRPTGPVGIRDAKIIGITDYGKRLLGLNQPTFVKSWKWKDHAACLARKDGRWCLAITTANYQTGRPSVRVIEFYEDQVKKDALSLGMTTQQVAVHEAEGTLRERWGWDG